MRTYSELILLDSFEERIEYLKLLDNNVLSPRHMSMPYYKTKTWEITRKLIIQRDMGFDLGVFGVYIDGPIYVHHINPIDEQDIIFQTNKLTDPDNLICSSGRTHNIIHYGNEKKEKWTERQPGDTILW